METQNLVMLISSRHQSRTAGFFFRQTALTLAWRKSSEPTKIQAGATELFLNGCKVVWGMREAEHPRIRPPFSSMVTRTQGAGGSQKLGPVKGSLLLQSHHPQSASPPSNSRCAHCSLFGFRSVLLNTDRHADDKKFACKVCMKAQHDKYHKI